MTLSFHSMRRLLGQCHPTQSTSRQCLAAGKGRDGHRDAPPRITRPTLTLSRTESVTMQAITEQFAVRSTRLWAGSRTEAGAAARRSPGVHFRPSAPPRRPHCATMPEQWPQQPGLWLRLATVRPGSTQDLHAACESGLPAVAHEPPYCSPALTAVLCCRVQL